MSQNNHILKTKSILSKLLTLESLFKDISSHLLPAKTQGVMIIYSLSFLFYPPRDVLYPISDEAWEERRDNRTQMLSGWLCVL